MGGEYIGHRSQQVRNRRWGNGTSCVTGSSRPRAGRAIAKSTSLKDSSRWEDPDRSACKQRPRL
jgi:hypothetical protein